MICIALRNMEVSLDCWHARRFAHRKHDMSQAVA
jgi:hypothetical protein